MKKFHVPFWAAMPEFDVLSDSLYKEALYIYNHFTRNHQELPKPMQYLNQEVLSDSISSRNQGIQGVVKLDYQNNVDRYRHPFRATDRDSELEILTLGRSTWRTMGKVPYFLSNQQSPVLFSEDFIGHTDITQARSSV